MDLERQPYWDLVDKKAESNNRIDLDAYGKGVEDGVNWQKERSYSESQIRNMFIRYMFSWNNCDSDEDVDAILNAWKTEQNKVK